MFCDLVDSTALSAQLDPEELREVVRGYQEACTEVIQRYDGYIAQHLGDGLLVYFSYPVAHEDDATRAVRAGLEIITALTNKGSLSWKDRADDLPVLRCHLWPVAGQRREPKAPFDKGGRAQHGGFGRSRWEEITSPHRYSHRPRSHR